MIVTIRTLRARYTFFLCLLGALTPPLVIATTTFFLATLIATVVSVSTHLGGSLELFETVGMPAFMVAFPSAGATVVLFVLWWMVYYKTKAAALLLEAAVCFNQ